jgi:hypothetical protein
LVFIGLPSPSPARGTGEFRSYAGCRFPVRPLFMFGQDKAGLEVAVVRHGSLESGQRPSAAAKGCVRNLCAAGSASLWLVAVTQISISRVHQQPPGTLLSQGPRYTRDPGSQGSSEPEHARLPGIPVSALAGTQVFYDLRTHKTRACPGFSNSSLENQEFRPLWALG